ncbi:MAG: DUF4115 domain-containing protein [Woeseiaceae bacterium]|nr:DUF4115 domain-containing protein [Woeseiaceae bacterium]
MGDPKDKAEEVAADEPQGPLGGERLADARRELQISVAEIAKELHLDEPKVHALERNDFDILGAAVFAKGHLRKYAQLVKVSDKDVMADYYQLTRAASVPPLLTTHRRPRREMTPGPWIAVIAAIVVVATAYWWFTSRPTSVVPALPEAVPEEIAEEVPGEASPVDESLESREPAEEAAGTEAPAPAAVERPQQSEIDDDDSSVLESATAATVDASSVAAAANAAAPPPDLGDGQMRMLLSYSGDCWTEISDARGRRLFFGLGKDGRSVELSGEAPFNVLLGNADSVSMRVNGVERVIAAGERRGRTARLTISGP